MQNNHRFSHNVLIENGFIKNSFVENGFIENGFSRINRANLNNLAKGSHIEQIASDDLQTKSDFNSAITQTSLNASVCHPADLVQCNLSPDNAKPLADTIVASNNSKITCLNSASSTIKVSRKSLLQSLYQAAQLAELKSHNMKATITWAYRFLNYLNHDSKVSIALEQLNQASLQNFLAHLAKEADLTPSSLDGAQNALRFFYEKILHIRLEDLHLPRLKIRRGFFSRFAQSDCLKIIEFLKGDIQLIAKIALFSDLKLKQVIQLRAGDIDLKSNSIKIRNSHGVVLFIAKVPPQLHIPLRIQLMKSQQTNKQVSASTQFQSSNHQDLFTGSNGSDPQFLFLNKSSEGINQATPQKSSQPTKPCSAPQQSHIELYTVKNSIRSAINRFNKIYKNNQHKSFNGRADISSPRFNNLKKIQKDHKRTHALSRLDSIRISTLN